MSNEKKTTEEELAYYIEMLKPHKEHLTSSREWNEYKNLYKLPHSQTLIRKFGSWNALKEAVGVNKVFAQNRPIKYDADTIKAILKEHGSHLTTKLQWDQYAKENKLPNYTVLFERLTEEEVFDITGYRKSFNKDSLKDVIKKYYPTTPPTFKEWEALGKAESDAPSASLIVVHFGSWKNMIDYVYE